MAPYGPGRPQAKRVQPRRRRSRVQQTVDTVVVVGRPGIGLAVGEEVPVQVDVVLVGPPAPGEAEGVGGMQQHHEGPAGQRRAAVSKPAQPGELHGGPEEPLDAVETRRDHDRAARIPRTHQRDVDGQLAPVRSPAGQQVVIERRRRRPGRLAEALPRDLVACGERIEHGRPCYSGIRANVHTEPPAGTSPRA